MKSLFIKLFALACALLVSGCAAVAVGAVAAVGMAGYSAVTGKCMNGPCAREHQKILDSIKPYGAYWVKEGMTKESRLDDIVACGSGRTEYIGFSEEKIKAEKRSEDPNDIAAYLRLREVWGECMKSKGYQYEVEKGLQ